MLIQTYFPTLMTKIKIHFLRFNMSLGPLLLSKFASNVDGIQKYWAMLENIAGVCWITSTLFYTLIDIAGIRILVNIRQQC